MAIPMEIRILRTRVIIPTVDGDAIHEKEVLQQFQEGRWSDVPTAFEEIQMPFDAISRLRFSNKP